MHSFSPILCQNFGIHYFFVLKLQTYILYVCFQSVLHDRALRMRQAYDMTVDNLQAHNIFTYKIKIKCKSLHWYLPSESSNKG